jgi:hypothetical protein
MKPSLPREDRGEQDERRGEEEAVVVLDAAKATARPTGASPQSTSQTRLIARSWAMRSYLRSRESRRSFRTRPSVWQVGQ